MPEKLQTIRTFFLVSAILNALTGLILFFTVLFTGFVTCGIGCCLGLLPAINVISGIMDYTAYNKLSSLDRTDTYSTIQFAAIMEIVSIITGNMISAILGIITLIFINEKEITDYLKEKNIY